MKCWILRYFIWVFTVCKRWQLMRLPEMLFWTSGPSPITCIKACQVLAVSQLQSKRRKMGLSARLSECLWMGAHVSTPPPILFNFWCIPVLLFIFVPCHLKCGVLWYTLRSEIFELSVRPSVTFSFPLCVYFEYFSTGVIQPFYKSWYCVGVVFGS